MKEKNKISQKIGIIFTKRAVCVLLVLLGTLLISGSIMMNVIPTKESELLSNALYNFGSQILGVFGGTLLTAGLVDIVIGFSTIEGFVDKTVGETYQKWTSQLLGEQPVDLSGLSEDNLEKLLGDISAAIIKTKQGGGDVELDKTAYSYIPKVLSCVAGQKYWKYQNVRTVITPSSIDNTVKVTKILDGELVTSKVDYTPTTYFETENIRDSVIYTKLEIDGEDLTEEINNSKENKEPKGDRRFAISKYGARFCVKYPNDNTTHKIEFIREQIIHNPNKVSSYVTTEVLVKDLTVTVVVEGSEANKWNVFANIYTTFGCLGTPYSIDKTRKTLTSSVTTIDCHDWLLPGTGIVYVAHPICDYEEDKQNNT